MNVGQKKDRTGSDPGKEIKHQKSDMTHLIFHPATKEIKKPHIPNDVQPPTMQKHVRQE
jgi:hypothetical protein